MDPQLENNGFGPLSQPRGNSATIASAAVFAVSGSVFVACLFRKNELHRLVFVAALLILSFLVGELLRRLCLLAEEVKHKGKRYQGSWRLVIKSTFTFKYGRAIVVFVVLAIGTLLLALYEHHETLARSEYAMFFLLNSFLVSQVLFLVGFRELSPAEESQMNEQQSKNVADGLAWSYYFGYLKLVLPHLHDKIGESQEFRHKITENRLFILLPKNCYAYSRIAEIDRRVTVAGNLPELKVNRAGIQSRSYKHTVHKITIKNREGNVNEYYCVVEYATPLQSLYDMSREEEAGLSREERDHQVRLPLQ